MAESTADFTPPNVSDITWANLSDVNQSVELVLGTTTVPFSTASFWSEGSLIELNKLAGENIDVLVNGKLCFRGEVVVVAENFGVRITEIVQES
jgi:flagellar motor switch protein FliN/FliY|tara:strand:- start:129 stop:410 length:282 start_codon:yes stop_codon:yes gene_type:complete